MSNSGTATYASIMPGQVSGRVVKMRRIELTMAILCGLFLVGGMPGLYAGHVIDITTLNNFGRYLCYAIAAMGLDLVWGYTGILSMCQAMFFVFGGYAIGMYMALHGPLDGDGIPRCLYVVTSVVSGFKLPMFWQPFKSLGAAMVLALLVPGFVAGVFGFFAFRSRVRGVYFSIITQALNLAVVLIFRRNEMRLCGTNGLTNFQSLAGYDVRDTNVKVGLYMITAITLVLVYVLCKFISFSRLGRLLLAVRDSESRLRFAGYNPVKLKLFAFVFGGMIAGLGGMLYSPQNPIITPFAMEPVESISLVACVALGGRGTLSGSVVGAMLFYFLQSWLTSHYPSAWPYVLGGLFIAVTLFFPDGIVGIWKKYAHSDAGAPVPEAKAESEPVGQAVAGGAH